MISIRRELLQHYFMLTEREKYDTIPYMSYF